MRAVIIDADSLVYAAGRANEHPIQWSSDLWTLHANLEPAIEMLTRDVEQIKTNIEADEVIMTLSDYDDPWRKQILPSYKSNRKDVRKPVIYKPLREYVHETYRTYQRQGLEGDDVIGVLMTNPVLIEGERVCVSLDKDLKTIPGLNVNLLKAQNGGQWFPRHITEGEADYYHMLQTLTGDTTDGYKGCPGMGPVSAQKLLEPFVDEGAESGEFWFDFDLAGAWKAIVSAYAKKGLTEDDALVQARVARICRHEDFDYTNKKVRLWNAPN